MTEKPLFVPLLDNGNGDIKASFMRCFDQAFHNRSIQRPLPGGSDSHANRGMNKIAKDFLDSGCEWWLNIDADTLFREQDIDNILSHGEANPLVYGIYPKKSDDTPPCLDVFGVTTPPTETLREVRWSGRGFMLVHRRLLERMKEDCGGPALRFHNPFGWDFFSSGPITGPWSSAGNEVDIDGFKKREWISEDMEFCRRARALGVPPLVDVRIALGHEGPKVYRFNGDQVTRLDALIGSWRDIHGWFDYEGLYRWLVKEIPNDGTFMEVGSWMGKSLAAFHAFAAEAKKNICVHACDTFTGAAANPVHAEILAYHGGDTYAPFCANMKALGLEPYVYREPSVSAATNFGDAFFDAVFIDAAHDYLSVRADILAWRPKVKPGGYLCGHDIDEVGVQQAVDELFPQYERPGRCWLVRL